MTDTQVTPGGQGPPRAPCGMHDERGHFVKGNAGGPGNPHHRRVAGLREALLRIVTEQDVEDIARKLIDVAKEGSLQAIKLFLAYVIGKPGATDYADVPWLGDNGAMPWLNDAAGKVDGSGSRQTSVEGYEQPSQQQAAPLTPNPSPPANDSPARDIVVAGGGRGEEVSRAGLPDGAPVLNGGKRLTRQQRKALRRQAKGKNGGAGAKLNGDNGRWLDLTPAEDPLATLARHRDLLR